MPDGKLDAKELPAPDASSEEIAACTAVVITPELAALRVIQGAEKGSGFGGLIDVTAVGRQLREQAAAVNRGDLSQAEAMLMNQATALQSLFARLAERGMGSDRLSVFEANMRMALRAQSQCRATLETLAAIKNPPVVFARQANIAAGHQQINNGAAVPSRARESETEQIQLSGGTHELLPDARTSSHAGRVDPALEALGEIDRAEVPRR